MTFIVAQLGARRHYAIPRMLHAQGMLEHFYTDICAVKGLPRCLRLIPPNLRSARVKRLLGRVPHDVPTERISAFSDFGREYARRRTAANSPSQSTAADLWGGKTFCERVIHRGFGGAKSVYTFNSAGLELLRHARQRGLGAVMEQTIAPKKTELALLRTEHAAFPDWQSAMPEDETAAAFIAREEAEWREADLILCGSDFVRDNIRLCGGPLERCVVVPYGVDGRFEVPARPTHSGPIRVLTVGEIGLRKGSPYVLAAAKLLQGRAYFRMVGSINIRPKALQQLQADVEVLGPVPRSDILSHFAWADVFLLPSLCEGSAEVTYEALACGLPVIATPNTGSMVRDGLDGFIVPIRDQEAIAAKLDSLMNNSGLLQAMSCSARLRAREGTITAYAQRLNRAMGNLAVEADQP